jgi:RecA/RadA recombinase
MMDIEKSREQLRNKRNNNHHGKSVKINENASVATFNESEF